MPDHAHLSFVFQLGQFLPHVVVDVVGAEGGVEEEHVHAVGAEAPEAAFDGLAGALRVEVGRGVFGRVAPELCRDQHAVAVRAECASEDGFGDAVALGVAVERGRVEERDAGVERGADRRLGVGRGDIAVDLRGEGPRAEPDFGAAEAGAAEGAGFHAVSCSSS